MKVTEQYWLWTPVRGGTFVLRGGGVVAIVVEIAVIQAKGVKFG